MREGGERLMPLAIRRPVKVFLVDVHARRGDHLLPDEHVVRTLGVTRPAEEGTKPAARAEARLVEVLRRFEHPLGSLWWALENRGAGERVKASFDIQRKQLERK